MRTVSAAGLLALLFGTASVSAADAQTVGSGGYSVAVGVGSVAISDQQLSATVSYVGLGNEPASAGPAVPGGIASIGGYTQQYATGIVMANANTGAGALVQQAASLALVVNPFSFK